LTDLDELIRRYPEDATPYELRSQVYERLGHHDQAQADLKRAGKSAQADAAQLNDVAWRLATGPPALRDPERAVSLAREAVAQSPGSAVCLATLGVALHRAGQYAEAIATLERSLAAGGGQSDGFGLFFLAMAHHRLGQTAQARDEYDRAVRWCRARKELPDAEAGELAGFRAEAESVLARPMGELPEDVFAAPQ
jgi:tetratricopeptide (TPR) repeat protein